MTDKININNKKNQIENSNINNFIKINISILNFNKLGFKILYLNKTLNINNFILIYDSKKFLSLEFNMINIINFLKKDIFKILENFENIKIFVSGFTRCIFENELLRPSIRNKFGNNLFFYDYLTMKINNFDNNLKNNFFFNCKNCDFDDNCNERFNYNLNNINFLTRLKPLISNKNLFIKNKKNIAKFKNKSILNISNFILDDFKDDKFYRRKKIVFSESFYENKNNFLNERILYYIYKNEIEFKGDFFLIYNLINKDLIFKLKKFLKKTNQFGISFLLMKNNLLRKTLYFEIYNFTEKDIFELKTILNINIDLGIYWGIGIDFYKNSIRGLKLYKTNTKIQIKEIKNFFNLDSKKKLFEFLNLININYLNEVLLDLKIKKNVLFSKRVDISLQNNDIDINIISKILGKNLNYFNNKELYTISFEIDLKNKEKINIYYVIK